jgi:uncharacterized membrane protein (Fun14 family)
MELTEKVVENLGKVFLNIGQGIVLGSFASRFFEENIPLSFSVIAFVIGVMTVVVGLYFISESESIKN